MKEKETQCLERGYGKLRKVLGAATLFGALSFVSPSEGSAKTISSTDDGAMVTEVTQQKQGIGTTKTIDLSDVLGGSGTGRKGGKTRQLEPDPDPDPDPDLEGSEGGDGGDDLMESGGSSGEEYLKGVGPKVEAHGFIQVGTSVVGDFASVLSDKPSLLMCVDGTEVKSGFGVTLIRLDDFSSDPAYPVSRASVIVPHRSKGSKDGKWSFGASVECTFIDKMPGTVEIMPVAVGSYSTGSGWTIEGKYFHGIQKGKDMDALRLGISKTIGDALSVTAQGWYKSDYDKYFFGRIIVDVSLGDGLAAQLSCIAKDGKLTPTAGVLYKF